MAGCSSIDSDSLDDHSGTIARENMRVSYRESTVVNVEHIGARLPMENNAMHA